MNYNDTMTKHGKGDFIVCSSLPNGKPNLSDKYVVNGEIFATTYNNTGFADCLGKVNAVNNVNFNTLPDLCTKVVEDDNYTLNIKTFEQKANLIIGLLANEFKLKFNNAEINAFPDYYLYHGSENEVHWKNAYVARNTFYATESNPIKVKLPDGNFCDKVYIELVAPMNKKHGCFHVNMRVLLENYNFNVFGKDYCFDIDMPSNQGKQEDGFYLNANYSFSTMNCEQMVNAILQHKSAFSFMYSIATKSDFKLVQPTELTRNIIRSFSKLCTSTEDNENVPFTAYTKVVDDNSTITLYGSERKFALKEIPITFSFDVRDIMIALQKQLQNQIENLSNDDFGLLARTVCCLDKNEYTYCFGKDMPSYSQYLTKMPVFVGAAQKGKTIFPYDCYVTTPLYFIEFVHNKKHYVLCIYVFSSHTIDNCQVKDSQLRYSIISSDEQVQDTQVFKFLYEKSCLG